MLVRGGVALAAVSYVEPHILVLDEPTNNLDLESVAALAECVEKFDGGVILVSHDQYFVGRVAKEVWLVAKGAVRSGHPVKILGDGSIEVSVNVTADAASKSAQEKIAAAGGSITVA